MAGALILVGRGRSVGAVADALRLTRSNLRRQSQKSPEWQDHRKQAKTRLTSMNQSTVADIREVLNVCPSFGYRRVTAMVNRKRKSQGLPRINPKRVWRLMNQAGLVFLRPCENPRHEQTHEGHVSVERSNVRWCSDGFEFRCFNREIVTVSFVLDCCDREAITYVVRKGKGLTAQMVQESVLLAVEKRFSVPESIPSGLQFLTDNGSAYRARSTHDLIRLLGLEDCKTAVCSPQSNGMAESFVRTMKRDYIPFMDLRNADVAIASLSDVFHRYNALHPHSALGYMSPWEFRAKSESGTIPPLKPNEGVSHVLN